MNISKQSLRPFILPIVLLVIMALLPLFNQSGFTLNVLINVVRWLIFALAFDLVAGHIGSVSLGQPIFYGIGAYLTAYLAGKLGLGWLGCMLVSAFFMALLALLAGLAFFRIRHVTFAIGTLGAAIVTQLVANSAEKLTGGALCTTGVPRPQLLLPFMESAIKISKPIQFYYLFLPFLILTLVVYLAVTKSRIGRAFTAVREDEVRASAVGIYPLRYKLVAFALSGALIGALGSWQAQYVTVICPSDMAQDITTSLLIMVFVGGAGRLSGVIIGGVIFSILPPFLQAVGSKYFQPAYQQILYGLILVGVMLYMPDGLDGLASRILRRFRGIRKEGV
ncbi:MAG: branched-chain amino acid ABC transporter permease [Anaerolineaceae bacterium]|nr:branched-chain amino acid ABC transporter permease [Anaerolineaceae bacterium]